MNSSRRVLLGGVASAGLLAPLVGGRRAEAAEPRPSVLLVGGVEAAPAWLAREGFCFENFHADYPFRRVGWEEVLAGRWDHGAPRRPTIARVFADSGYATILAGSCQAVAAEFQCVVDREHMPTRMAAQAGRPVFAAVVCEDGQDRAEGVLAVLGKVRHGSDLIVVCVPPFRRGEPWFDGRPPLIVHAPGRVGAETRSNVAMNLLDVAPTVFGLVGLPVPDGFPGVNYAGLAMRTVRL